MDWLKDVMAIVPMAAGLGVVFAAIGSGLLGGLQYMADRRYVTRKDFAVGIKAVNTRLDAQDAHLQSLDTNQQTQLELTRKVSDQVDELRASLRSTDATVREVMTFLQGERRRER